MFCYIFYVAEVLKEKSTTEPEIDRYLESVWRSLENYLNLKNIISDKQSYGCDNLISINMFKYITIPGIAFSRRILTRTFLLCYCVNKFYDLRSKKWLIKISGTNSAPDCDPCNSY